VSESPVLRFFATGRFSDTGGDRARGFRRASVLMAFRVVVERRGRFVSTSPSKSAMKASSSAVAMGCYTSVSLHARLRSSTRTLGFDALVAACVLKYFEMPLLICSCFSLSSSRFRLASSNQHWSVCVGVSVRVPALPRAGRSSSSSLSVAEGPLSHSSLPSSA
jgi:hypothetical protein